MVFWVRAKTLPLGIAIAWCASAVILMALLPISAWAQTSAPKPSAEAQALVDAIGIENLMTAPMHQQMLVFMRPLQEANKARQQEVFEIFEKLVMPQASLAFTSAPAKDKVAEFYSKLLTASEMKEVAAFFSTPVGKKFAKQNSAVADALPLLAAALLPSVTVQGALHAGVAEIEKRGMTVPGPPAK
jgi:hypothetical protein